MAFLLCPSPLRILQKLSKWCFKQTHKCTKIRQMIRVIICRPTIFTLFTLPILALDRDLYARVSYSPIKSIEIPPSHHETPNPHLIDLLSIDVRIKLAKTNDHVKSEVESALACKQKALCFWLNSQFTITIQYNLCICANAGTIHQITPLYCFLCNFTNSNFTCAWTSPSTHSAETCHIM